MRDATGPGATAPGRGLPSAVVVLVALAAAAVLVTSLVSLVIEAAGPHPVTPYVAPQYWLSYEHGFVRRALPGEVLRLLLGDRPPGYLLVRVVGIGLSVLAVLAVLGLAAGLARLAADRRTAVVVAAVLVVSPLGLALYARDLGRSDALGVVLLVALVAGPWRRWPPLATGLAVALLTTTAVAVAEFLVVPAGPLALLVLGSAWAGRPRRRLGTALTLLPAAVLTVLCAVLPTPRAELVAATAAARAAGVPPSVPLVPGQTDHDAVSRLGYGFWENVQTYYGSTTPAGVLGLAVGCALLHVLVLGLVWRLLGGTLRERAFGVVAGASAAAALVMSVAGIDYRRWWSLALVAALAAVLHLAAGRPRRPVVAGRGLVVALVVLALAGVALQNLPLWPVTSWPELRTRLRW